MKKILFFLILLIPFIAHAEVKIKDVEVEEKTAGLQVEENPSFEGLKINLDLTFKEVEDFVKYKVTVKNDTKKDYEIDKGENSNSSEYIKYTVDYDEKDGSILKAGEEKIIYITASYIKEVPESSFVNGKFVEKKAAAINLVNEEEKVNPSTKVGYLVLTSAIIMFISLVIILVNKHRLDRLSPFVIALAVAIPLAVWALEKLTIEIETNITIELVVPEFCVSEYDHMLDETVETIYYPFVKGSTWDTYLNSDLNQNYFKTDPTYHFIFPYNGEISNCRAHLFTDKISTGTVYSSDIIESKENGCYYIYVPVC